MTDHELIVSELRKAGVPEAQLDAAAGAVVELVAAVEATFGTE